MAGPLPRQLLPLTAEVDPRGRSRIGGVDLLSLADELGTPLFVYDEAHLRARCQEAVDAFGHDVAYASKAFLCKAMAQLVAEERMRIDVSTGGELYVARAAGVPGDRLVLHGNNKSDAELAMALEHGVGRIVVDSFDELDRIERLVLGGGRWSQVGASSGSPGSLGRPGHPGSPGSPEGRGDSEGRGDGRSGGRFGPGFAPPQVLLRVTPGVEAHTHEYVMTGQEDSKFGFGLRSGAAAEAVARAKASRAMDLMGIHVHIGSQIFLLSSFVKAVEVLASFVVPLELPELVVGGGLGVAYVEGEEAPTISQWGGVVRRACAVAGIPATTTVTAEPGRAIVADAAVTCYTIGTIKRLPGLRTYVAVDGGMSDNPRPVLYGSGYEAFLPRATAAARPMAATVVGKHCESGDVVVRDACLPADVAVGDVLATPVTGAYGHSMASNYNKIPRPAVVFVKDGEARVVVRREGSEDLVRLDR